MLAHRRDRGRRVMAPDLVDDGEVLADHHLHAPGHRQGHAPAAVDLALGRLGELPDAGITGALRQRLVEGLVGAVKALLITGVEGFMLARDRRVEPGDVLGARPLGQQFDGRAFERLPYEHRLGNRADRNARHEGAGLREDLDEAFLLQPDQRLAHRRAAHSETGGQILLRQRRSRPQLHVEDLAPELVLHHRGGSRTPRGNGGHALRPPLAPARTGLAAAHGFRHRLAPAMIVASRIGHDASRRLSLTSTNTTPFDVLVY